MNAACHRFASPGLDRLYGSLILWNAYPGLFPGVKRSKCEPNIMSLKILRIRGDVTSTPHVFVAWFLLEQREDLQKLTCFTLRKYIGGVGTGSGCYPVTHFGNSSLTGGEPPPPPPPPPKNLTTKIFLFSVFQQSKKKKKKIILFSLF